MKFNVETSISFYKKGGGILKFRASAGDSIINKINVIIKNK